MTNTTTAREIAEAAGVTKRGIEKRANKENWLFEEVAQRGGRQRHYPTDTLPAEIQAAVRKHRGLQAAKAFAARFAVESEAEKLARLQQGAEAFAQAEREKALAEQRAQRLRKEDGLARFAALSDGDKKQRALARKYLIELYWQHAREVGCSREAARVHIVSAVNTGSVEVPAKFVDYIPQYNGTRTLTEASLHRWELDYLKDGIWALVDKHGHRKNCSTIETTPELMEVVLGCMLKHPHITAKKIKQYLESAHAALDIVSEKAIQRFKTKWIEANHETWTFITNPDKWKNVYMAAVGSHHENILRLNQLWEMDSTPADWMLTDGRHSVVGVIDMYSRRLKFHVSKTSSAYAVCQTFRRAVLDWGIPECVRTDNGKDYVSTHFNEVLDGLLIGHELCLPFASEEKGTIERAMRTMSHGILDLLPGFIGHNVAERKVIEARKSFADRIMQSGSVVEVALSAHDLQKILDQWCEYLYGRDAHGGLGGKTPWQVANAWLQPIRTVDNLRALDALLTPITGTRTITASGVQLDNHFYWHSEFDTPNVKGRDVSLKRVDGDLGRVHVYLEGEYLCEAECPQLLGISSQELAAVSKKKQKALVGEHARELKELKQHVKANVAEVVLQHRIEQAANVSELPKRAEAYTTPALDQAARSVRSPNLPIYNGSGDAPEPVINNVVTMPVALSRLEEILERDDDREIYRYWLEVNARFQADEKLSEHETRWHRMYPSSASYASGKKFFEEAALNAVSQ